MNSNLVAIIRNSLSAAQAALDLIAVEQAPAALVTSANAAAAFITSYYTSPVPAPVAPVAEAFSEPLTSFAILMNELNDPRYTLRSTRELAEKSGLGDVKDALNANNVAYVTKRRTSDGAELIGLLSRN